MGKKRETNISGVYAPAVGKERYQVIRSRFVQGTAIIPFVYLTTDDLDEATVEASDHPDKSVYDTQTQQIARE